VKIEVEVRIILPRWDPDAQTRLRDELAKPWERLDQARSQDLFDAVGIDRLIEPQQRVDDLQVRRPVHVQPRRGALLIRFALITAPLSNLSDRLR
jgi:hypothetical protein